MNRSAKRQTGFALMLVLVALVIAVVLGTSYLYSASIELASTENLMDSSRAMYLAESAVNHALYVLQSDPDSLPETEAESMGPFTIDSSGDTYRFFAVEDGPGRHLLYGLGTCGSIQRRCIAEVYSENVYKQILLGYGPVSYWRLGDTSAMTARDETGAHHGQYNNGVDLQQAGVLVGESNRSASFDGVNDYVDLGDFDIPGEGLSLVVWFCADSLTTSGGGSRDGRLICKADALDNESHYWEISTCANDGKYRLRFRLRTGKTKDLKAQEGNLETGKWVFAVATYDGSQMYLYKDAVRVGATSKSGDIDEEDDVPVWIGGNPAGDTARPWHGRIDEAAIFDYALSEEQIQTLYKARTPNVDVLDWSD